MKLFIACLGTETNSFVPMPTGQIAFEEVMHTCTATRASANLFSAPLHIWRELAKARGWDVAESLSAFAQPAGSTIGATYEQYREEILGDLAKAAADIALFASQRNDRRRL